jgi:hypothetical protein
MHQTPAPAPLPSETASRLAEFARSCKAAARAVSLYPSAHPAVATSLERLVHATGALAAAGPVRLQTAEQNLLIDGMAPARPDLAIADLAELLNRHLIGRITLNPGISTDSWRTLLQLLARTPDDVRGDGGIARLWETAGGPSIEIEEVDYAEVLREKIGSRAAVQQIIAAALEGPQLELDDSGMRLLLEIVGDPARLDELLDQVEMATAGRGDDARTAAFLRLLRGLSEWVSRKEPERLAGLLTQMGRAAGRLSADGMLKLLAERQRPDAPVGGINVAGAVVDRISDASVVQFVAGSVVAEGGATERLAHAFQALVPDVDRQRQLLALVEEEVTASPLGQDEGFADLWHRVESLLTSYTDDPFVPDEYGRELSSARSQAVDVERTSDDPPERIAAWLGSVSDAALRGLDHQLLLDLLAIERDPLRWRDVADTVAGHAVDLVRVGYFDEAAQLMETIARTAEDEPARRPHAGASLERFGSGGLLKHVAPHLRVADDPFYERFKRLCHTIGAAVIAPLAEALSVEQDARARRRLRDILVGFGARGRESVQPLMNAPNWEVRRTAAYLLREFGGTEGLKELAPLLADNEPLVQREAVQGLVMNASEEAAAILLRGLTSASGRVRDVLINEVTATRDPRMAPMLCYFLRHLNRRAHPALYLSAVEALGSFGGPDAVDALNFALHQTDWRAPLQSRRIRAAAAKALARLGTSDALTALRDAAANGRRAVKSAARAELARIT